MSQVVRGLATAGLLLFFLPSAALAQPAQDAAATAAEAAADATMAAQRASTYGGASSRAPSTAIPRAAPGASRQLGGVLSGVLGSYLGSSVGGGPHGSDIGTIVGSAIRNATQIEGAKNYPAHPYVAGHNLPGARSSTSSNYQVGDDVRWIRRPDGRDVARYYPDEAARLGIRGTATMHCSVTASGNLENCAIASETPAGHGFGNALVRMHRLFRAEPMTIGEPGSRIIPIQIRFAPAIG